MILINFIFVLQFQPKDLSTVDGREYFTVIATEMSIGEEVEDVCTSRKELQSSNFKIKYKLNCCLKDNDTACL
jgi:hypothetical protein